jgi:hypothetical protein
MAMKWTLVALACVAACKKADKPAEQKDPWASGTPAQTGGGGGKKWYQGADAPVGVWMGIDERMSASAMSSTAYQSTYLRLTTMVVWPDGHLSEDAPWAGLADFDYAAWARDVKSNPSLGGSPATYAPEGDGWHVKFDSGFETSMKMVGDELRFRKARLKRMADVTGATLDGMYTWYGNAEDPSLAGPGCQPLVRFGSDGTFENRGGFARTCPAGDSDPGKPGSGTYEIRDFSLILKYADGRTDKRLISSKQNADLHSDNASAIIMGQVWSRRTGPTDTAPVPTTPTGSSPPAVAETDGFTSYDVLRFRTPPGKLERGKTSISFTSGEGESFCMTSVFSGLPSTGQLDEDFKAEWKDVMLNGRTADQDAEPQKATAPSGLPFMVAGSMTTEASNNARVFRALLVFGVDGRRVSVMIIAPTEQKIASCGLEELIRSVRGA